MKIMRASAAAGAAELYAALRSRLNTGAVQAGARRPFRIFLCGDPGLVSEVRRFLLSGHDGDEIPRDAAACVETLRPGAAPADATDAKAIVFLGRGNDREGARLDLLTPLKLPVLAVTVDESAPAAGPANPPKGGESADYVVPSLAYDALRGRVLPHLIECCAGVEVAVGRRLPALRETVAAKLTRDAALNALKVAGASAIADHVPVLGLVFGAFASAGDMLAITGIQVNLMLNISATYGKDPDVGRMWELLPIVGGGLGWRALSRELSGFVPVAGPFIKAGIAYAGTIVVGEGVAFYHQYGRQMSAADASRVYDEAKATAARIARDVLARFYRNGSGGNGKTP